MWMKLEMPLINPSLRGGHILRWNKRLGDRFEFGDVLCTVVLDEFAALRRTGRATLLSGKRRNNLRSDLEVREGKVSLQAELVSSDRGIVHEIVADDGDHIKVGDILAVVTTGEYDGDETNVGMLTKMPIMRVAANLSTDNELDDSREVG